VVGAGFVIACTEDLIAKIQDARLQRVARARVSGKLLWQIAEAEHCSTEYARQLWLRAQRVMMVLRRSPEQVTPDTKIEDLMTSTRLQNVCQRLGVVTIGDLAACTEIDLLYTKHCGAKTTIEAMRILTSAGLDFQPQAIATHSERAVL
jgi:DNA-directed RNA polymerase alpha subunit